MPALKPIRFGKYLLLEKIGTGGMAELYRAKIVSVQGFEKLIAIKRILPHLAEEEELVDSFIDEAKLAALLHHQNIVHIYDFGAIDDSYFIAMEYLFGKDLGVIIKKSKKKGQPLTLEHALLIATRICNGLDYAHNLRDFQGKALNIIHRDVSPQNILVTYEGDVKIVDFGIAKAATQSTKTQAGMIKGKVAYMSPEQAAGKIIDHRSDIFSTGIILYELVTGSRMFKGDTLQILSRVREAEFAPPEQVKENLPAKVYEILRLALAKKPEQRYQSAAEMLLDLEECTYQLSMRPSPRELSRYMKLLFKEEKAAAESSFWEGREEDTAREPEVDSRDLQPVETEPKPKKASIMASLLERAGGMTQERWYAVLASAVFVSGLILLLVLKQGGISTADRDISVASKQASLSDSAKKTIATEISQQEPEKAVSSPAPATPKTKEASPSHVLGAAQVEAGMRALQEKRFAEAVIMFKEALALEPYWLDTISKPYALALQGQAQSIVERDPGKAKELLLKAVQYDPGSIEGHFQLGLLYDKLKEWPKAIESYQKVTELNPQFPDAYFNLGYVYASLKDYQRSEEMYDHVVELAPSYLDEAYFNLAVVQVKLGKNEQGMQNLEEAIALNPENDKAKEYLQLLEQKQRAN